MTQPQPALARPPRVDIPETVWTQGDQLAPYIARMAVEHGPIFSLVPGTGHEAVGCRVAGPMAGREVVYLTGPDANRFVLLTHREHFSHELGWSPLIGETLGQGLLNMDPPEHTRHRRLMNPAFAAALMAEYLPLMQRIIADRIRDWADHDEIDLLAEARKVTFDVAAVALMGFETGPHLDFLREWFDKMFHARDLDDMNWEHVIGHQTCLQEGLRAVLTGMIAARRSSPGASANDVLSMLVHARDEQGQALTDEQLLAHVNVLLIAGHETTTTLGSWLIYLLATHPDYGARVDAELTAALGFDAPLTSDIVRSLPLLTNAIREAGRLQSPVMLLPRGVLSPVEFAGYTLTPGTPVFLAIAAGHRLPTVFADPERFDPDRFLPPREEDKRHPYALVTFGGGPRICPGINFAQLEIMALAAHVRRRFRIEPLEHHPIAIAPVAGILQSLPEGIRVRVRELV